MANKKEKKPMQESAKQTRSAVAGITLDTSGLRSIGTYYEKKKDDSFAAEYARFVDCEAERILEEEALRSIEKGERNVYSVKASYNESPSAALIVKAANEFFIALNISVCKHMHEYLLKHNGKVKQWADPETSLIFSFDCSDYEFRYNYFGGSYYVEDGKIIQAKRNVYHNSYHYSGRRLDEAESNLRLEFARRYDPIEFFKETSQGFEVAKYELEQAKKKSESIRSAKLALILVGLMVILAGLATAVGLGAPLDLAAFGKSCTDSVAGLANSLPKGVNLLVGVVLGIPAYLLFLLMMVTDTVGTLIFEFFEWGKGWGGGSIAVLWGAVVMASLLLGVTRLFGKNPLPEARQRYREAKEASRKRREEYDQLEREFKQSDRYKQAVEKDRIETERDCMERAANEAFAEQWQRAWFEAVES